MKNTIFQFSSVQLLSCVRFFATPWTAARQASLSITISQRLLKFMSIKLVMASNHPILCHPLLLSPSIFPSIRVFSNESVLHSRWPKYWSFSFSISPSNEHSGLISFKIDWFDLLAVQGTLKSLLQYHSSKASILQCSAFFIVQFSHPYMTTGKTIALTRWIFVGKIPSLLFNMLSRLVIAFLPRSKCLNFMAAITICSDFGAPQNKVSLCFHCFPIYLPWSDGIDAMILVFWILSFKTNFFTFLFHFHQEALHFSFAFCHKGGIICISEVIDISPVNFDSSLCFIQPSILHDVLCI